MFVAPFSKKVLRYFLEVLNTVVVKNCTTTKACHGASKQTSLTTVCASANRNLATLFFLFPKSSTILFGSPKRRTTKIPRVQNCKLRQERSLSVQKLSALNGQCPVTSTAESNPILRVSYELYRINLLYHKFYRCQEKPNICLYYFFCVILSIL